MAIRNISPLVMLIFIWVQIYWSFQPAFAQNADDTRQAVAVTDLDATGITDHEKIVLSDRLRAEIWKTQKYDVLERQKMDDLLKEQGFQLSGACDQASCLLEIGRLLPVEKVVGGSVGKIGNTWTITLRMINIATGRIEKTVTRDCPNCTIDDILNPLLSYAAADMAGIEVDYAEVSHGDNQTAADKSKVTRQSDKGNKPMENADRASLPAMESGKKGGSIFGKWWFWGIMVAGAGGGAAVTLGSKKPAGESSSKTGSINIQWK